MERYQARQEQAASARNMELLSSVGGVAAAFLGAAAGSALSGDVEFEAPRHSRRRRSHSHDDNDGPPGGEGGGLMDALLSSDDNSDDNS